MIVLIISLEKTSSFYWIYRYDKYSKVSKSSFQSLSVGCYVYRFVPRARINVGESSGGGVKKPGHILNKNNHCVEFVGKISALRQWWLFLPCHDPQIKSSVYSRDVISCIVFKVESFNDKNEVYSMSLARVYPRPYKSINSVYQSGRVCLMKKQSDTRICFDDAF